jgi:Ca-activated chloride channel family protein
MAYFIPLYKQCCHDVRQFGGVPLWLLFRCLPGAVLVSLALLLLSVSPARAGSDSREPTINDVQSGHFLLRDDVADTYIPALIQSSKVHFDISGMIATVSVQQTFRNTTDRFVEGVYAFPLPDDAAVRALEMEIGERLIVGKIREKEEAKKIYQAAKKAGKKASLVEQQRPNLFSNRVANIGPGEQIVVRLEYVQAVAFESGAFSLRFPTTITPRYMPGFPLDVEMGTQDTLTLNPHLGWAQPTDQVLDADAISPLLNPLSGTESDPINAIEITAQLDMGMPLARVDSPFHDIALSRRAGVYSISLVNAVSEMDRDFVLNWQPVTGSSPQAALFTEKVGDEYFGLLMVVPPSGQRTGGGLPREIIFVVDTSGSMGGVSIEQARASVAHALDQLRPQDRFNIIEFNSQHRALFRNAMPATRHHVQRAQEFVRLLDASGGTEMASALRAALAPTGAVDELQEQSVLRQVIFITDGAVGNEEALFTQLVANLGHSRLFTVGIGSAPNSWFMRKAAQFGRGSHTHIGDLNEVGEKMADLFERLAHPAAVNLAVTWSSVVEAWPERVPDLYRGHPLSIAVNFGEQAPSGDVQITGEIDGKDWRKSLQIGSGADPLSAADHNGVASLWARGKIAGLLDQKIMGRDEELVRANVLPIALQHQLLSPYTSFVAVEEIVSRPKEEGVDSTAIANTRPRGQAAQNFAYPRTATTGPAKAWFGMLLMFVALIIRVMQQDELDHAPATQA